MQTSNLPVWIFCDDPSHKSRIGSWVILSCKHLTVRIKKTPVSMLRCTKDSLQYLVLENSHTFFWEVNVTVGVGVGKDLNVSHFEVAQETGSRWLSKCIVGLFWGTNFPHGGKFVPQNSPPMHLDNHLKPVSRATFKWLISLREFCEPGKHGGGNEGVMWT